MDGDEIFKKYTDLVDVHSKTTEDLTAMTTERDSLKSKNDDLTKQIEDLIKERTDLKVYIADHVSVTGNTPREPEPAKKISALEGFRIEREKLLSKKE